MNDPVIETMSNENNGMEQNFGNTQAPITPQVVSQQPIVGGVVSNAPLNAPLTETLDFGDLKLDGIKEDDSLIIGQKVEMSKFPVNRLKFADKQQLLLSIPIEQVIAVKTHYEEGIGQYKCFGGSCCDKSMPNVRFIYPVIIYDTNAKLEVVSRELKFASLVVGDENHRFIEDIFNGLNKGDWDLIITCTEAKYQKLQIRKSNSTAIYKTQADMIKTVKDFWSQNYKHILKPIVNIYTEEELNRKRAELMGSAQPETTQLSHHDMDSIFNNN